MALEIKISTMIYNGQEAEPHARARGRTSRKGVREKRKPVVVAHSLARLSRRLSRRAEKSLSSWNFVRNVLQETQGTISSPRQSMRVVRLFMSVCFGMSSAQVTPSYAFRRHTTHLRSWACNRRNFSCCARIASPAREPKCPHGLANFARLSAMRRLISGVVSFAIVLKKP